MSDPVDSRPASGQPMDDAGVNAGPPQFGLTSATALIVGSIIGVGIFNLPTSLAVYGPISLVSMALTTVGALALALLFAALSRRLPADGGPYAYARAAFGNALGFANAWSYWITAWAGNAAIAVGWVLYVEQFINTGHNPVFSVLLVLVGLWIPAPINLSGVKNMGAVQVVTTILKFVALAFMATVGLFFIKAGELHPVERQRRERPRRDRRRHGHRPVQLPRRRDRRGRRRQGPRPGSEHPPGHHPGHPRHRGRLHAVPDRRLRHPAHLASSPRATAPFSDAANAMFGGTWAGNLMAIVVIISGFGALNGWTMICAEMPLAAAKDGLFPERFKRLSRTGRAGLRRSWSRPCWPPSR